MQLTSNIQIVHNCTIILFSLDVGNIDDQCRGPSIKEKGHLAGLLTSVADDSYNSEAHHYKDN